MPREIIRPRDVVVGTNQAVVSTNPAVRLWVAESPVCNSFFIHSTDPTKPGIAVFHCPYEKLATQEPRGNAIGMLADEEFVPTSGVSRESLLKVLSEVLARKGVPKQKQRLVIMPNKEYPDDRIESVVIAEYKNMAEGLATSGFFGGGVEVGEPSFTVLGEVKSSTVRHFDSLELPPEVERKIRETP